MPRSGTFPVTRPVASGIRVPAPSAGASDSTPTIVRWGRTLLRVPILPKLVVLDLLINILAIWTVRAAGPESGDEIMVISLLATLVINAGLVYWALLPLKELERTATRVLHGELQARVPQGAFTDRNIARIGETLNHLLDTVTANQARVRQMAAQVLSVGDQERAHIARELHDSTAQSLGALDLLLVSALRDPAIGTLGERLRVMQGIVGDTLAEVRSLSHSVHPRVVDEMGLVAALEWLSRLARDQSGLDARVTSDVRHDMPPVVAAVLYRVAQEAMRNAAKHASATTVRLGLTSNAETATLEIVDDGCGFDPEAAARERPGLGLFIMRERVALLEGTLEVTSAIGHGTLIRAVVPMTSRHGERP